jgi:hypothetical protein
MWMGQVESDFVAAIVNKFGAPTTPIILRQGAQDVLEGASS